MYDSQTTSTGYTLGRIFLFQKEEVSQVSMANSHSRQNTFHMPNDSKTSRQQTKLGMNFM